MHLKIAVIVVLSMCLIILSCKSNKYTLNESIDSLESNEVLYVGSGGGFSGKHLQYYFLENGQILSYDSFKKKYELLDVKIRPKQVKQFYKMFRQYIPQSIGQSGNYSEYIALKQGKNNIKATWPKDQFNHSPEIQSLYQSMMSIVKKNNIYNEK